MVKLDMTLALHIDGKGYAESIYTDDEHGVTMTERCKCGMLNMNVSRHIPRPGEFTKFFLRGEDGFWSDEFSPADNGCRGTRADFGRLLKERFPELNEGDVHE